MFLTPLILVFYDVYEDDLIPVLTQLRISLALFVSSQKDYEELAISVMSIVDCLVHKTNVNHPLPLIRIFFSFLKNIPLLFHL